MATSGAWSPASPPLWRFRRVVEKVPLVQRLLAAYSINVDVSVVFPLVLLLSLIGCLAGTLLTKPDDEEVLKDFYRRVRPWGFWGPVLQEGAGRGPRLQAQH